MAKDTYFRLGITVTGDKLSTVIGVLDREGVDLKVEQIDGPENGHGKPSYTKQLKTADGRLPFDVVKTTLSATPGKDMQAKVIEKALERAGFAPSTAYASLSKLIFDGDAAKVKKGVYRWIGK